MYPPVAVGMPRVVPKGGANIAGTFVPEDVGFALYRCIASVARRADRLTDRGGLLAACHELLLPELPKPLCFQARTPRRGEQQYPR